ncbi:MAG: hypothetical protein U5K43_11085 [Halofilum sp. (in: g-proteobacteria)]|nr:hypothetical protein [Halofilum sp. (in: g-proteobacteria)]
MSATVWSKRSLYEREVLHLVVGRQPGKSRIIPGVKPENVVKLKLSSLTSVGQSALPSPS